MCSDPGFMEALVTDGSAWKLRSQCLRCGDTRIVSVMDGSLQMWHREHRCGESKRPSQSDTPSPTVYTAPLSKAG
jgi:hypothetical protein